MNLGQTGVIGGGGGGGKTTLLTKTITYIDPDDRVVEGLRIPANLNTVSSINFVLTQEPGKLKPKDLKAAIERNRAEREQRAEEQKRLREEGGGAGMLDLRGILAEERLNAKEGDPFQRQLREMAFLADVEEVEKLENEKAFRISEDYLGSNLMSTEDINFVYRQREMTRIIQMKGRWRNRQGRQKNNCITPIHPTIKAGVLKDTAHHLMTTLFPQYDPNKNDIWQKRLNTLRRFVYLVSTWLVRERLNRRMRKLKQYFHEHGATTRAEVRAFIEKENLDHRSSVSTSSAEKEEKERKAAELAALNKASGASTAAGNNADATNKTKPALSAAEVIFSKPNTTLLKILRNHQIIQEDMIRVKEGEPEITTNMASRQLYPTFDRNILTDDRSPAQRGLLTFTECLSQPFTFDDRSFFHQKIQPEFQYRQYTEHTIHSLVPLHLPALRDKELRSGAPEEYNLRVPADQNIHSVEHRQLFYVKHEQEPVEVVDKMLVEVNGITHDVITASSSTHHTTTTSTQKQQQQQQANVVNDHHLLPAWISSNNNKNDTTNHHKSSSSSSYSAIRASTVTWKPSDLDLLTPLPEYRAFIPSLLRTETDVDAIFHHPAHPPNQPPKIPSFFGHHQQQEESSQEEGMTTMTTSFDLLIRQRMQRDQSLRNTWQDQGAGYLSAHYYLLAGAESRWRPAPQHKTSKNNSTNDGSEDKNKIEFPPMGPLLSDYYQADHDRHVSGLNCFSKDHLRDVTEWDSDIAPLQHHLAKDDKLTDSESDHDDDFYYASLKPSMAKVKALLHPPKPVVEAAPTGKGGAAAKGTAKPAAAPVVAEVKPDEHGDEEDEEDGIDGNHKKNEAQVELLRDRKTLDVESTIWRHRKSLLDDFYRQQCKLAGLSSNVWQSVRVQLPFHVFEDEVYKDLSSHNTGSRFHVPTPSNVFVEVDPTKQPLGGPHGSLSMTPLGSAVTPAANTAASASPTKK